MSKESFQYRDGSVDLMCDGAVGYDDGASDECEETTNMGDDGAVDDEGWSFQKGTLSDTHYCPRCTKEMQGDWPHLEPLPMKVTQ